MGSRNHGPPYHDQVFVTVDYVLDQLVINYPHIEGCIDNSVGLPIPWDIENMNVCSNEVFETCINSSGERINLNVMTKK